MLPRPPRSRRSHPALALLVALLAACGGGGGGGPVVEPPTDLGLVSATRPTTIPVRFDNPRAGAATVTRRASTGAVDLAPGAVPAAVAGGGAVTLDVVVTPDARRSVQGTLTLRFDDGTGASETTRTFRATPETVPWSLPDGGLDFGTLDPGQALEREVRFRNDSALSPVTLTRAHLPSPSLTLVGSPLPLTVAPGAEARVTVRFAPTAGEAIDAVLDLGPGDLGGPVRVPVRADATGPQAELVTDFGLQTLVGMDTPQLFVDVPADALSLTLEGLGASGSYGLGELIGPGGTVYENTSSTGTYLWSAGAEVFSTTVPNSDRSDVQLVPGGGRYAFRIRRLAGNDTQVAVRAIVEVRGGVRASLLDLNVWLADGLAVTAATAAGDVRLQAILTQIDAILGMEDVRLGAIDYYDVTDPAFDDVTSPAEFAALLRSTGRATSPRLNLFFVETALGGGVVGVSATVSGPRRNGTSLSGVMATYRGFTTNVIGLIGAHEIGHFLGLYHTVDQDGSHDIIDDTAACPPTGTDAVCPTEGGGYLMHWQAVGGTDLSAGQGLVLRAHPLLRPAPTGPAAKPTPLGPPRLTLLDVVLLGALGDDWCGCPGCPGH